MCEQCLTESTFLGEFLPDWYLTRATKDGHTWKANQLGLVQMNDPSFVLTSEPVEDPGDEAPENVWSPFSKAARQIQEDLLNARNICGLIRLVKAAEIRGYLIDRDGDFSYWLSDCLAKFLKTAVAVPNDSTKYP
jgi:hypothetical protein